MAWIQITEDHVRSRISADELARIRQIGGVDAPDPVAGAILQVTREVRGYAAAPERNTLGPELTIPDECLGAAVSRIIYELVTSIPTKTLATEQRIKANENALTQLRDVAAGRFRIALPLVESTEKLASAVIVTVTSRPRVATRQDLGGL